MGLDFLEKLDTRKEWKQHKVYKPVVLFSYYEHDNCLYVEIRNMKDSKSVADAKNIIWSETYYGTFVEAVEAFRQDLIAKGYL